MLYLLMKMVFLRKKSITLSIAPVKFTLDAINAKEGLFRIVCKNYSKDCTLEFVKGVTDPEATGPVTEHVSNPGV